MPGSSSDGVPPPPKEKNACDREIERIEGSLDEMCAIREQCVTDVFETREPALDVKGYFYKCTSAMPLR